MAVVGPVAENGARGEHGNRWGKRTTMLISVGYNVEKPGKAVSPDARAAAW